MKTNARPLLLTGLLAASLLLAAQARARRSIRAARKSISACIIRTAAFTAN